MEQHELKAEDYYNQAIAFNMKSRKADAVYYYSKTIELDSSFVNARKGRAKLYIELCDYKNALEDYLYLQNSEGGEDYKEELAFCYEQNGDYIESFRCYLELSIRDMSENALKKLYNFEKIHPELRQGININEVNAITKSYVDEERAKKFSENASNFQLDQRNYFLFMALSLLPNDSPLAYEYHMEKAYAEVLRYKICLDEEFREELKEKHKCDDERLNKIYKFKRSRISETNLVQAMQTFYAATRYASNLEEVNVIDREVENIRKLARNNTKK